MKNLIRIQLAILTGFVLASAVSAGEANLTRFGPVVLEQERKGPTPDAYAADFRALEGPAELVLEDFGIRSASIRVNGDEIIVDPRVFDGNGTIVLPLELDAENTIEISDISVPGKRGGTLGVRVTQQTEANFDVRAKMYYGVNTSDLFAQFDFYQQLGLVNLYPAGPESCRSFARSLGFPDDYLIYVSLSSFSGAAPWVDTVQFREDSFRSDPPYANLNHIGMAYATYATTDLDGDYALLKEQGVEFVSAPAKAPNGERFVFLKDQDGTFLKLIEMPGPRSDGIDLFALVNTNMNVADLERSREFYRLLGFTEDAPGSMRGSGPFAKAHGLQGPIAFEGVDVSLPGPAIPPILGGDPAARTLQLRQWTKPFDGSPPYAPPVNHLGIDRIAFYVDDIIAVTEEMNRLGFEQLGPIGSGGGPIGIVFFLDPDGIKVEFWGPLLGPNPNADC